MDTHPRSWRPRWDWPILVWMWLLALVPAYSLPRAHGSQYLFYVVVACSAVGYSCIGADWARLRRHARSLWPVMAGLVVLVAWRGLSLAVIGDRGVGFQKLVFYTLTGPVLFWIPLLWGGRERPVFILRGIAALAIVVGGIAILEFHLGTNPLYGAWYDDWSDYSPGAWRPSSTFGNPVMSGTFLAATLPFVFALGRLRMAVPGVVVVTLALLLCDSQSGWLAAAMGAIVYGSLRALRARRQLQVRMAMWLALSALLAVTVAAHLVRDQGALRQYVASLERVRDLGHGELHRLFQYGIVLDVVREKPLLGIGFGRYTALYDQLRPEGAPRGRSRTTESSYLMAGAESGVIGMAVLGGLVLWILFSILRAALREPDGETACLSASMASLAAMSVGMAFWDMLNAPQMRMYFWTLCGWALALVPTRERTNH